MIFFATWIAAADAGAVVAPLAAADPTRPNEINGVKGEAVTGPGRPGDGRRVVVPKSSVERPQDVGKRAHTNYEIVVPFHRIEGAASKR